MLVSTTLAGPGAEASIVDALRSCSFLVEKHLIAFAGAERAKVEAALEREFDSGLDPARLVCRDYAWPNSYGTARNEMLRWAESLGATWALTVDCDERVSADLQAPGVGEAPYSALVVPDRDLGYSKPRWLRCGAGLTWQWPCAERLVGPDGRPPEMLLVRGSFWELPKDEAAERRRAERGVEGMHEVLRQGENAHARRHLAECLLILGETDLAAKDFERAALVEDAPLFEVTWCRMRQAELACVAGEFEAGMHIAAAALASDPGLIQELGWIIAHANAQLKNFTAAALWCSYVLNAPWDYSRGGHRSRSWKDGATRLLAGIEAAVKAQRPELIPREFGRETFEHRGDAFAADYLALAMALHDVLGADSTIDLGAGNGLLLANLPGTVRGLETSECAREATPVHVRNLIDFGVPLEHWARSESVSSPLCELVTCVEVAEHIPEERAMELVDACISHSSRWIYFSAAQPGQGGLGHVNERPRSYWIAKFNARGWVVDGDMTAQLAHQLERSVGTCWWLPRNALILRRAGSR